VIISAWKKGGDGDSEQLMYELDMWFELQDKLGKVNAHE